MKLFGFVSSALVALVASGYAAPTVEAVDSGDVLIASVTAGSEVLRLGDIAAANSIAVAYQQGNHSYLRWSTDGGTTFAAPWALRSGLRAKDPRVAACDNTIWAVSIWRSDNASNVGVDHVDVTAPDSTASRYSLGSGYSADIACTADAVGVAWLRDGHAQLDIFDVACQTSCAPSYSTDLGVADSAFIAPTDDGFVVSAERRVQPFGVEETAGGLVVTPGPLTLISGPNASPVIAVDGARVVIAYSHSWDNAMGARRICELATTPVQRSARGSSSTVTAKGARAVQGRTR